MVTNRVAAESRRPRKSKNLSRLKSWIKSFMTEVPNKKKPFHWLALQIQRTGLYMIRTTVLEELINNVTKVETFLKIRYSKQTEKSNLLLNTQIKKVFLQDNFENTKNNMGNIWKGIRWLITLKASNRRISNSYHLMENHLLIQKKLPVL